MLLGGVDLLEGVNVLSHLPDLKNVVLADAGHDPVLGGVPAEIGYLGSVASVDEEELWRAIGGLLLGLLLSDPGNVPDMYTSVVGAGG